MRDSGKNDVTDFSKQLHRTIKRNGRRGKLILAHPIRNEGGQRQPEQQMQVGPKQPTISVLHHQ